MCSPRQRYGLVPAFLGLLVLMKGSLQQSVVVMVGEGRGLPVVSTMAARSEVGTNPKRGGQCCSFPYGFCPRVPVPAGVQVQLPGLSHLTSVGMEEILQPGMSLGLPMCLRMRARSTFTESLQPARHCCKCFTCDCLFNPPDNSSKKVLF